MFEQLKDDSSSLIVLYDSASFVTERSLTTTATSKFSLNFAFDSELLQHRVYKGALRAFTRKKKSPSSKPQQPKVVPLPEELKEVSVHAVGFPKKAWRDVASVLVHNLPRTLCEVHDYRSAIQALLLLEFSSAFMRSLTVHGQNAFQADLDSGCAVVTAARDGPRLPIAHEVVTALSCLSQNALVTSNIDPAFRFLMKE